jgi:hypothetical protein
MRAKQSKQFGLQSNLFKNLEMEAFRKGITPRTDESRKWFRQRAQSIRRVSRKNVMNDDPVTLTGKFMPGAMCMFYYQPKHKDTLPYYDAFPLIIVVDKAEGGFYGLNLHYLPPMLRAKFLDGLMDTVTNQAYDETTRIGVSYEYLKKTSSMKYFKPCFKHYLTDHVRSRFGIIPATEWEIATFLPLASWQKQSGNKVYKDSRGMI